MASLLHKLLKNNSSWRLVASINHQHLPKPTPFLVSSQINHPRAENLDPIFNPVISENPLRFYPSFPFGHCLNPVLSSGSDPLAVLKFDGVESDDAGMIYADSVKKKRKKKMNKHKYKKLRKRLRRKT